MRHTLSAALGISVALTTGVASAQSFGRAGDVSFAADRLSGIYFVDEGFDLTLVAMGASPPIYAHPYTTTRLGIDFFVIDHLSLGGSLAFWLSDREGPGDDPSGFLFAPRVGYALNFGDSFGFWPRGGFTIRNIDGAFGFGGDEVALTLEAMFFGTPVNHMGFLFGPTLDLGIAGDGREAVVFGLLAGGLFGWL